ncbi:hypothetical protein Dimus_017809 [Dionaea muscipula]
MGYSRWFLGQGGQQVAVSSSLCTRDRLVRMGITTKTGYVLCGHDLESRDHLFLRCSFTAVVKGELMRWLPEEVVTGNGRLLRVGGVSRCRTSGRIWTIATEPSPTASSSTNKTAPPAPPLPNTHLPLPQLGAPPHGLPPNVPGGPGYGAGPQYMLPPRQLDNYYLPADMPNRQTHRGIPTYGRELPMGVHASSNAPPAPTMIAQVFPFVCYLDSSSSRTMIRCFSS